MESDPTDINWSVRYGVSIFSNLKIIQFWIDFPVSGKKVKCMPYRIIVVLHGVIRL